MATPPPAVRVRSRILERSAQQLGATTLDITALYRRYGDMVLGRCRTLLGNDADAQEAMQEVFLNMHRNRGGFRGEASPSTYLYKTTTHTCLNWIRSRRRRKEDSVETLPQPATSDSVLDTLEVRQLIDQLLASADERTQAAVIYHFVDGMTHDETGTMLGITGGAVRKRIAKFRAGVEANPPKWLNEEVQ